MPFVDILATQKVPKLFSLIIIKKLASQNYNHYFCESDQYDLKLDLRGSFPRLFSDFRFWTFINVHFSKPKILFRKNMLLKITTNNLNLFCDDAMVS